MSLIDEKQIFTILIAPLLYLLKEHAGWDDR